MNFAAIASAALARAPDLLPRWFPQGRLHGREFRVGSLRGEPGRSLSVNVETGAWKDFNGDSSDSGGDLISLLAARDGVSQSTAAWRIADELGLHTAGTASGAVAGRINGMSAHSPDRANAHAMKKPAEVWEPQLPAPCEPPGADQIRHLRYGTASEHWVYRDEAGEALFSTCRFDLPAAEDGKPRKEVLPYSYGRRRWSTKAGKLCDRTGWHFKRPGLPMPLYGLDRLAVRPEATVLVVEGEKTADRAARMFPNFVAITSQGGSGAADQADWTPLEGRTVAVWPDQDAAGRSYGHDVAQQVTKAGATSVGLVAMPEEWPSGWDLADEPPDGIAAGTLHEMLDRACLLSAKPDAAVQARASAELKAEPSPGQNAGSTRPGQRSAKQPADSAQSPLPSIRLMAGELHTEVTEGEAAIIRAGLPIYQRGTGMVRPVCREVAASRGRTTISASLENLTVYSALDVLCQVAHWERYDARCKDWVRADPPAMIAHILLSRHGQWCVPCVAGVITTPTLRLDGSLLDAEGYDPVTQLHHVADAALTLSPAVHRPTREDAERALGDLKGLLAEFPFVKAEANGTPALEVALAVALSAMITPIVRGALSVAPLHAFVANTPGSGKSYLVDLVSSISSGQPCPVTSWSGDESENEKRLGGLLLAGYSLVCLDNVNGELGGDLLCQAVERPLIRLRPLGSSAIVEVESRATIMANGNNMRLCGDMVRRSLRADLDAEMERPETRTFKGNPVDQVLRDRGRYVSACLVIVRAYAAAGHPGKLPPIASFEDWSDHVRSALVWLGCADPARSMDAVRNDDPELGALGELLALWTEAFGTDAKTVKDVIKATGGKTKDGRSGPPVQPALEALRQALLLLAGDHGDVSTRKLGNYLVGREGRIVENRRFKRAGKGGGGLIKWQIVLAKLNPAGSG